MNGFENIELPKESKLLVQKELVESFENYQTTLKYMLGDAPISSLCLDKPSETILISNGLLRVYDLFDRNLTEIKGLGDIRIRNLTTRLNEFLSVG